MKDLYKIKQIIIIAFIVLIIGGIILNINFNKKSKTLIATVDDTAIDTTIPNDNKDTEEKISKLCYYKSDKTDRDLYDRAWLKLDILGEKISGEFYNLPAEKDSKIGKFEGTVGPVMEEIMGRRANVWWNSLAEGMEVKEELIIEFGEGSATVGFGEMINRGDGVYVYKNKENLTYLKSMGQIDCETLDEKIFVEKYIRENIKTIANNNPILGGSWYVVSVTANPINHNGEVTYEDGHIESKATFIYNYEKIPQAVTVTNFEVKK